VMSVVEASIGGEEEAAGSDDKGASAISLALAAKETARRLSGLFVPVVVEESEFWPRRECKNECGCSDRPSPFDRRGDVCEELE